ncbi:S-methyl-5-thioribose-1-phosphate isomerase [Dactylosporangium matsuzakiense]|uniref:Methylthioribose-1-phosphate isomerase n=1 Tax=Dactylosporangium matsuzakiense TaxID=53360 RepID=A0A9W6KGZ7_9ACTN|nr:S-methyl-5-thioribose-1-phosphate isomerase [Dactylosporangium matsuzakiense]UWZ44515.1 S-methyl-5-thioribose-1-phosphate isomerase [Dactylosporangium matsuzakiense]GLL01906.1 methylthioribose-1-phosphate isomerase [Dactylosporangium matsuzakiense]
MRTIDWIDGAVVLVDQTRLPGEEVYLRLDTVAELVEAIQRLRVRGAPAIGVAGALGVALAAKQYADPAELAAAVHLLETARPTAVNLARGVRRVAALLPSFDAALGEALRIRDEEIASSKAMARLGADLVEKLCGADARLLTHCNTGGLATVVEGTALSVVFELYRRESLGGVIASETRPLLQGARLTTWELRRAGIAHRLAVDSAGPFLMARGEVDAVILGADRICANGDVVNKVGSYAHALGAKAAGIPFICVAPESTVDLSTPSGADVEIEDRGSAEVAGTTAPEGTEAINPAFDVTPAHLVTAIVTDERVFSGRADGAPAG